MLVFVYFASFVHCVQVEEAVAVLDAHNAKQATGVGYYKAARRGRRKP